MSFDEALKQRVRRRAAFRCCRCGEIGVEVHHIVPQASGGSDDEDNAAPLCPNCHENFGDNPKKRKVIGEMRDHWYDVAAEKWPTGDGRTSQLDEIKAEIQRLADAQAQAGKPKPITDPTTGDVVGHRISPNTIQGFRCPHCSLSIGTIMLTAIGRPFVCPECRSPFTG